MIELYRTANKGDVLEKMEEFRDLLEAMIAQSIECAYFILAYTSRNYLSEFRVLYLSQIRKTHSCGLSSKVDLRRRVYLQKLKTSETRS